MRLTIVFLALLLAGCTAQPVVHDLSPAEAAALIKQNDELFVLNVHTPYEGELEGTDEIIQDWENIAAHTDQLPADKNQPILVYCRSDRMSTSAAEQLKQLGYKEIYNLKGGMRAYNEEGLPGLINYTAS